MKVGIKQLNDGRFYFVLFLWISQRDSHVIHTRTTYYVNIKPTTMHHRSERWLWLTDPRIIFDESICASSAMHTSWFRWHFNARYSVYVSGPLFCSLFQLVTWKVCCPPLRWDKDFAQHPWSCSAVNWRRLTDLIRSSVDTVCHAFRLLRWLYMLLSLLVSLSTWVICIFIRFLNSLFGKGSTQSINGWDQPN